MDMELVQIPPVYDSPPKKKMKRSTELVQIPKDGTEPDPVDFARSYQIEALEQALEKNTILFLETRAGKTLVAIMLLRSYAYQLRKPSPFIAVFLVPTGVLVTQQAKAVTMHTDLKVGMYCGQKEDYWDAAIWKNIQETNEEFYHSQKGSDKDNLPRIFGMTASPVKAKASGSSSSYLQQISKLENLMNSEVLHGFDESFLATYIPISTTNLKLYDHMNLPYDLSERVARELDSLKEKYNFNLQESTANSTRKRLLKLHSSFMHCMKELGVWLALKAAETLAREDTDGFSWGKLDVCCTTIIRNFSLDASKVFLSCLPSGPLWSIGVDMKADLDAGYLSSKVVCLIESLLGFK